MLSIPKSQPTDIITCFKSKDKLLMFGHGVSDNSMMDDF